MKQGLVGYSIDVFNISIYSIDISICLPYSIDGIDNAIKWLHQIYTYFYLFTLASEMPHKYK